MNPFQLFKPAAAKASVASPAARKNRERIYAAAEWNRLTADWAPTSSSADAEIVTSLRLLRNRSRQLVRDNEYAKNGLRQIVQNVIGTGVKMAPTIMNARKTLMEDLNDKVHEVFHDWYKCAESAHVAGLMSGAEIERFMMSNVVESGEGFCRFVRKPFGESKIPLSIEVLEADRVMDQWTQAIAPNGNIIRMGVEVDQWFRPKGYWCWPTHPGDWQFATFQPSNFIRIPADDICHLFVIERWPQTRGVPWFHAAMKRLNNMGGYEESEIVAARGNAAIMGFITSPDTPQPDDIEESGKRVDDMEPGQIRHLLPGEDFKAFAPNRPNAQLEPFMRFMLRAVSASLGVSYETLARDYSNTNYSSARASLIEDRDMYRVVQLWFINRFRVRLHREFMSAAVISGQLSIDDFYTNEQKYLKAHYKPRGWVWIDPSKEVAAYTAAVRSGFMTVHDVIDQANSDRNPLDMFKQRRAELDDMAELDLVFDTDPAQVNQKGIAQPNTAPEEEPDKPAEPGEAASQGDSTDDSKPAASAAPAKTTDTKPKAAAKPKAA
jgi:lambda family phage portal protein